MGKGIIHAQLHPGLDDLGLGHAYEGGVDGKILALFRAQAGGQSRRALKGLGSYRPCFTGDAGSRRFWKTRTRTLPDNDQREDGGSLSWNQLQD